MLWCINGCAWVLSAAEVQLVYAEHPFWGWAGVHSDDSEHYWALASSHCSSPPATVRVLGFLLFSLMRVPLSMTQLPSFSAF